MSNAAKQLVTVQPGLYLRGDVDYDAIEAVNFSTLKYAAKSPLEYLHRLHNPKASTTPQLRGSASHTAILEPERLESDYAIFTGKVRNGKVWDAFEAQNAHRKIIKQGELDQALRMQRAVRSMPCADAYLSGGHAEVTLVWVDDVTGILCKGRVDYVKGDQAIVDLKGTGDAGEVSFAREAGRQKYHVQAAFYLDGYTTLFPMAHPESVLIAVEYSEPHDVAPYVIDADSLEAGRRVYRACLDRIAQCRAERRWPGVANGSVQTLRLPAYELMEEDGDVELTVDGESITF